MGVVPTLLMNKVKEESDAAQRALSCDDQTRASELVPAASSKRRKFQLRQAELEDIEGLACSTHGILLSL